MKDDIATVMDQQPVKLDVDDSPVQEEISFDEESKDLGGNLNYSRDKEHVFSMDDNFDMGKDNRKGCEVDKLDKNIITDDELVSEVLKRRDDKKARKDSRKDSNDENVDKTKNSNYTVEKQDKTKNTDFTVEKQDKPKNSISTVENLEKVKKEKKSNDRNKKQGRAKDLGSSKNNTTKGKPTNTEKRKKTEDKNAQKNKHISNEKNLKEKKNEPAATQSIPKEKENNKRNSLTDNILKDKALGQGKKERRRSLFTESTRKDTIRELPNKIVTTLRKKRQRKIKDAVYTESLSEEIKLKMRKESRDTRSSLLMLEEPIMEESEEEDDVGKMRSSSELKPITSVIITPRLERGFSHNPFNMSDPRNGGISTDSEDDRHSINTDFYTPDLNSRDDVFSDFEDELDTSNLKPLKKKKKKTKKMKRLEKKQRAKKRKARLLYEKIRGFCDSLYDSESLTISIKRERKLKLDTYLPDRQETRKYRIKRRKLALLIKVQSLRENYWLCLCLLLSMKSNVKSQQNPFKYFLTLHGNISYGRHVFCCIIMNRCVRNSIVRFALKILCLKPMV